MTNANEVRRAHKLLDYVSQGRAVLDEEIELLRSFLPELPKRKTLEELRREVCDVWAGTIENEWPDDMYCDLENWLYELHVQLQGLADAEPAKPAHPEFLETEADYENAPEGTIVACEDSPPWHKFDSAWLSTITHGRNDAKDMTGVIREVLRWSWGNE